MNKKISLGAAFAFMFIVAAATFCITMIYSLDQYNERVNKLKEREELYEKFTEIDRAVRLNYNGSINENLLLDSVARGYVEGIGDAYATYISAEEYQRLTQESEGENVGIGAVLEIGGDGYLVVQEVYEDSPAQVRGIEVGDLIVRVDETDITLENSEQMLAAITGAQGTTVSLVVRQGSEDTQMELTRRAVAAPSVSGNMMEGTTVGYLQIREFGDSTSDQFNRELQRLLDAGANSLVFDLRGNAGGSDRVAARIMDKLLPGGPLIRAVYRDDKPDEPRVLFTSDASEINLPMVCLTNEETANLAEVFVQAIRDYDKGRSVGTVTAGNGVIQEIIKLSAGSAIDLTVAYLYPPYSDSFHGAGLRPDFEVTMEGDWTGLDQEFDTQLQRAVEVAEAMEKAQGLGGSAGTTDPEPEEGAGSEPGDSSEPEESSRPEDSSEADDEEDSGENSEADDGDDGSQPED